MGRRAGRRWVRQTPNNYYFTDLSKSKENSIVITVAEFEAMRLKHYVNLNQSDSAEKMGISQPTFSRVLDNAHRKMTLAILEGKSIRVYGGIYDYKVGFIGYGCINCDLEWEDESASKDKKVECPQCNSKDNVYFLIKEYL